MIRDRFVALAASLLATLLLGCSLPRATPPGAYLFVWIGDSARTSSDFLGVIDANPASPAYGSIVASLPVGVAGSAPHHTEQQVAANSHLLANGFDAGESWLFDLTNARSPKIVTAFGDRAGFSYPHSYVRLPNGHVLATFQRAGEPAPPPDMWAMRGMMGTGAHTTGGLVEMDERGTVIRSGSARDTTIPDARIYPYAVLPLPEFDRAISTTTDMDEADTASTDQWLQLWRLSDLKLLKTFALTPGPGAQHRELLTGELRLLPDGKSVYVHTFSCGIYLLRGLDHDAPVATLVDTLPKFSCGVPILAGHFWIEPVPMTHSVVSLDIADPEHPKQVSAVTVEADEAPHWLAIDPTGKRIVMNSGGTKHGNRLFIINLDPATGALSLDDRFRDPGSVGPGLTLSGKRWPHGFTGTIQPHGAVFSR